MATVSPCPSSDEIAARGGQQVNHAVVDMSTTLTAKQYSTTQHPAQDKRRARHRRRGRPDRVRRLAAAPRHVAGHGAQPGRHSAGLLRRLRLAGDRRRRPTHPTMDRAPAPPSHLLSGAVRRKAIGAPVVPEGCARLVIDDVPSATHRRPQHSSDAEAREVRCSRGLTLLSQGCSTKQQVATVEDRERGIGWRRKRSLSRWPLRGGCFCRLGTVLAGTPSCRPAGLLGCEVHRS
ncbi:hypothetical protein EV644_10654 [Kribbella orskensis]|uniref:Uncharacterized protein n=1 Tax=Kribbella orskensis TaxID=2512216 RepID=A0ABY2BJP3_9ACTN|nr:hypothetical protein EV642_10554 [Kribbella sp. VKM Ac-2500]TCO22747.1 hypothetical protein EV644_10654 [Kribbella orskensis]